MVSPLLAISDGIDEACLLIEAAWMAANECPVDQSAPIRTLLGIIEDRLHDLGKQLSVYRKAEAALSLSRDRRRPV